MAEESNNNDTAISKLILEFDDLRKQLDGVNKELKNKIIPEYEPSAEKFIMLLITEWIERITTICHFEKLLLHYVMSMDRNLRKVHRYYSLIRLAEQRESFSDLTARLQDCRNDISNNKASRKVEKIIDTMHRSFGLFDKIIQLWNEENSFESCDRSASKTIFKAGDENGLGTVVLPDGEIYLGECKNGLPAGRGTVVYPDGCKYIGEIDGLVYEGHGMLTTPNGAKYVGRFSNDKFNGQGVLTDPDGNQYKGEWEDEVLISEEVGAVPYYHSASGIEFPVKLAGMERIEISNYELTKPGLGISVGYNKPDINATIYLYGLNFQASTNCSDPNGIEKAFQEAVGDIYRAYESGAYDGVVKLSEGKASLGDSTNSLEVLSASFMISQYGVNRFSHLFLGRHKSHFLKIRFSYSETEQIEGKKLLELFTREIGRLVI